MTVSVSAAAAAPYNYAGEEFLSTNLPNYPYERFILILQLILAFVLWLIVFPMLSVLSSKSRSKSSKTSKTTVILTTKEEVTTRRTTTTKNTSSTTSSSKKRRGKKGTTSSSNTPKKKQEKEEESSIVTPQQQQQQEGGGNDGGVSDIMNILCIIGFLITFCYVIIIASPDNKYTTRGVYEAPLFTRDECKDLVQRAERAAQRNYESALLLHSNNKNNNNAKSSSSSSMLLLEEPIGWQKKRHAQYSTTDLNVVTDPFTKDDREWIKNKLDARLAPTIQRLYGVPIASIRANDVSFLLFILIFLKTSIVVVVVEYFFFQQFTHFFFLIFLPNCFCPIGFTTTNNNNKKDFCYSVRW